MVGDCYSFSNAAELQRHSLKSALTKGRKIADSKAFGNQVIERCESVKSLTDFNGEISPAKRADS